MPASQLESLKMDKSSSEVSENFHFVDEKDHIKPYVAVKRISDFLDSWGVEVTGIERVLPYRRAQNVTLQLLHVTGLWILGCGGLSSMLSFYLGPMLFGLGLRKTLVVGMLGQGLGCLVAAYCSLMGPRSGCRQMVSARFLFGWWFVKVVAVVCIIGGVGWSVVNCIVGGQILSEVSDGRVPLLVLIVIIAVLSLAISVGGIRVLLRAELYLLIPVTIAFVLLYAVLAPKFKYLSLQDLAAESHASIVGNSYSFFALCYSITATWGGVASDYYILFPESTPDVQIFSLTFLGIFLPTTFVGVIALMTGNIAMNYAPWGDSYESMGMGGLLAQAFAPWGGGGKFLLIIIFLSLISNNVINTYLGVFDVQLIGLPLARVPRWLWLVVYSAVYLALSIVGRYKFATILGNFLPMVGYWISMYVTLLLEENVVFRTKWFHHLYTAEFAESSEISGGLRYYNFAVWNDQKKLTQGYAAAVAFCCGAAGAAVGMSQTYWIGPLALKVGGDYGGDIAMWLCIAFSAVLYPPLRYLELKRFGR